MAIASCLIFNNQNHDILKKRPLKINYNFPENINSTMCTYFALVGMYVD